MGVRAPATNQIPAAGAAAFLGGLMADESVSRGYGSASWSRRVGTPSARMAHPAWNAGFSRHSPPQAGGEASFIRRNGAACERGPEACHNPLWHFCYPLVQRYAMKETTTKITVHIPTALLQQARSITGEGVTSTVRRGLRQIAAAHAQKELRELRGQVPISLDLEKLREDRDPDHR